MKKEYILSLLLLLLSCQTALAGNLSKRYYSYMTSEGMLYYICPQKMPKMSDSMAKKPLLYDVTHLSTTDTVTISSTIWSQFPLQTDSVRIVQNGKVWRASAIEVIYVERDKNLYKTRVRFPLLWAELKELYSSNDPFILDFYHNFTYLYPLKEWNKKKEEMNEILRIIELNRKQ